MKKAITLLLTVAVTLTMCFSVTFTAFAADEQPGGLKVVVANLDGSVSQEFDFAQEELKDFKFSTINNAATVQIETVKGLTVKSLMERAGVTMTEDQALKFECADYDPEIFNYEDIFGKRYCYTNITDLNAVNGAPKTSKAKKVAVEPVLAAVSEDDLKLYFGQAFITERNKPLCLDNVIKISVVPKQEKKTLDNPVFETGEKTAVGEELNFVTDKSHNKMFIYYTVNGKKPTVDNARIYNCGPKADPPLYNKYKFSKVGTLTVKAVMKSCNKTDSNIVTKTFTVKPAKAIIKKLTAGQKSFTVQFKSQKSSGITGYKVYYQKVGASKWNTVTVSKAKTSSKVSKLKKGAKYNVKVRAYAKIKSGKTTKTLYGAYSDVKVVTAK